MFLGDTIAEHPRTHGVARDRGHLGKGPSRPAPCRDARVAQPKEIANDEVAARRRNHQFVPRSAVHGHFKRTAARERPRILHEIREFTAKIRRNGAA